MLTSYQSSTTLGETDIVEYDETFPALIEYETHRLDPVHAGAG
jgi:hypothetical protein